MAENLILGGSLLYLDKEFNEDLMAGYVLSRHDKNCFPLTWFPAI